MIRVLLVDDQNLIREGVKALLDQETDLQIVGEADNGQTAIELVASLQPDVVLMDISLPVLDGIAATEQICQQCPGIQVLMLTTLEDDASIAAALRVGATGYLLKSLAPDELAHAVRTVAKGYSQLSPGLLQKVIELDSPATRHAVPIPDEISATSKLATFQSSTRSTSRPKAPSVPAIFSQLTNREQQVLKLIATGANNREIAQMLKISEGTVKNHVASILGRLNLRDRTQAAIVANSVMLKSAT